MNKPVSLGEVASIFNGKTPSKADQRDAGHPVLKIKDVSESALFKGGFTSFVDVEFAEKHRSKSVEVDDTLILNAAHNSDYVGSKQYRAEPSVVGSIATGEWLIARANPGRLNPRYLNYWLGSNKVRFLMKALVKGIHLYPKDVSRLEIPLPTLAEQQRIAAILDKADALRRKRQQAIDLADQFLRSVFLEMFGDPVSNPKGWVKRELQELIDSDRPITYGILKPGEDVVDGVPYIRVVDMKDGVVNTSAVRRTSPEIAQQYKRSTLKPGDLLLSIRGHVGRLALVPDCLAGANITQDTARLATNYLCDSRYLFACLDTKSMQFEMGRYVKGAAVKGINLGDVKELQIPVPPMEQQMLMAKIAASVVSLIEKSELALNHTNQQFASLSQQAFSGEQ